MRKVKLTEGDLTRIVKRVLNENEDDVNSLIKESRDNYDSVCYEISKLSLDEIPNSYHGIMSNIGDYINKLESIEVENDEINYMLEKYKELDNDINQIITHINYCQDILNKIW